MTLPSFCRETVEVLRPARAESRGTRERDWSSAEAHAVAGCLALPSTTVSDASAARHATSTEAVLYAPPGADIRAGDRVTCSLGTFDVDGVPQPFASPSGSVSRLRCYLSGWRG